MPKLLTIRIVQEVETHITQCRDCEHWPENGKGQPATWGHCGHGDIGIDRYAYMSGTWIPDFCPLPDAKEEANATR